MLVHTHTWIIQKYTFGTAVSEVPPSVAWAQHWIWLCLGSSSAERAAWG